MALSTGGFDRSAPLPPGLTIAHIGAAIEFVEEKAEELIELYFEQANIFSGVVGILGVRALDSLSPYKRHKHPDIAQQRFLIIQVIRNRYHNPHRRAGCSTFLSRTWNLDAGGSLHGVW